MRRRSRAGGETAKTRRHKAATPKRRSAPKAARRRDPSVANLQARLERQARELTEAGELQAATAEVLRIISISPHDIQPVFDAIAENAVRLCQGQFSFVVRFDNELLRFGACHGLHRKDSKPFSGCFRDQLAMTRLQDAQSCTAPSCKSRMYWRIPPLARRNLPQR